MRTKSKHRQEALEKSLSQLLQIQKKTPTFATAIERDSNERMK